MELDDSLQTVFSDPMQPPGTNGVMVTDETEPLHVLVAYVVRMAYETNMGGSRGVGLPAHYESILSAESHSKVAPLHVNMAARETLLCTQVSGAAVSTGRQSCRQSLFEHISCST